MGEPDYRSEVAHEASARTRRLVGLGFVVVLVAAALALRLFVGGPGPDAAIRRGVASLIAGIRGGADGFDAARRAFGEALRARPFDGYPPFLLHLTDLLQRPPPLPPQASLLERAIALCARGELEQAHALLEARPIALRTDGEHYLLRFLDEALGQCCVPEVPAIIPNPGHGAGTQR